MTRKEFDERAKKDLLKYFDGLLADFGNGVDMNRLTTLALMSGFIRGVSACRGNYDETYAEFLKILDSNSGGYDFEKGCYEDDKVGEC